MDTFYFQSSRKRDSAMAAGTGCSLEEGIADAIKRMHVRWPQLQLVDGDKFHEQRALLEILQSGLVTGHQIMGSRGADRLGSGQFMNKATELVALEYRKNPILLDHFAQFCKENDRQIDRTYRLSNLFERNPSAVKDRISSMVAAIRDPIDWSEVVEFLLAPEAIVAHKLSSIHSTPEAEKISGMDEIDPGMKVLEPDAGIFKTASDVGVRGRTIAPDVLDVLRQCRVVGNQVFLPPLVLKRELYAKVNDVLVAFGGQWKGGKLKAHVFEDDPSALLDIAVLTGEFVKPQDFGYFPTPKDLVEQVLSMAEIEPGMKVLEPSAGRGAFALAMLRAVGGDPDLVTTCELLPSNAKHLHVAGITVVYVGDFLAMEPKPIFDRIVMNPPFNGGIDVDHVLHAAKFLNPTGRLTAITSVGWTQNSSKKANSFREFVQGVEAERVDVPAGAFKQAGTNVPTQIIQFEAANLPWYREEVVEAEAPAP